MTSLIIPPLALTVFSEHYALRHRDRQMAPELPTPEVFKELTAKAGSGLSEAQKAQWRRYDAAAGLVEIAFNPSGLHGFCSEQIHDLQELLDILDEVTRETLISAINRRTTNTTNS